MSQTLRSSSSSSVPYGGGPLTTTFTPPPGCFEKTPSIWSICTSTSAYYSCFWSLPASCYPTDARTMCFVDETIAYHYSPGVLPSGFTRFLNPDTSISGPYGGLVQGCLEVCLSRTAAKTTPAASACKLTPKVAGASETQHSASAHQLSLAHSNSHPTMAVLPQKVQASLHECRILK